MPERPRFARSIAIAGREMAAFARQAWLLRHDARGPVLPRTSEDGDDVVVLIHGLFASAGVLRPLRSSLEKLERVHTARMSYAPGPSVEALAQRLDALLAELAPSCRIHLVGHSLGGVVARHFAQTRRDARVVQTISLASPFAGVTSASLFGLGDLAPDSALLRRLRLDATATIDATPHLSIVAGSDAILRSPVAHALPSGEVRVLLDRGHNELLFDAEVAAIVTERVRERGAIRANGDASARR
jgi:pimeloyl-ACP methyl ester carboxylesterase